MCFFNQFLLSAKNQTRPVNSKSCKLLHFKNAIIANLTVYIFQAACAEYKPDSEAVIVMKHLFCSIICWSKDFCFSTIAVEFIIYI